ncbi:MAG: hypothetical protein KDE33_06775, partial [Bacteroidetes bacterium]|nr:hypothetical protein [Bacteroidota bacterium]
MKLKFTAFLCSLFFFYAEIYAQCELTATVLPADIVCGDCTQLTAFGQGQGLSVFTEDFNSGAPTGWQSTSQATITSTLCNPHPSGTQYLWMGDAASVPRILTTTAYDFTAAVAGATICFDMVFAEQGNATPCEGPDEPDEGVAIQYSIDGGTTWTDINYFDPNGGNDPSLINWNTWCFAVPAGGLTNNTQFRWFQDNDSGAEYDHWGLDNVDIYFNDATYEIVWQHDGYSYGVGNSGGTNPTPVCPQTTTTYTVTMSNGTTTCTDQVTVNVSPPTFRVTADTAQTICAGECVDLVGEATVIKNPAAVRQFENNDFAVVATGSASVNVNVQGMNAQTITPGLITEICVNSFDFSGSQLCTDFLNGCNCNGTPISFGDMCNLDVSSFTLTVTTPDNCTITLVPAGVATQGYNSVCFVPSGGANINSGTFPTSGTWNPNEPFSVLDGCSTEGVWTLEFDGGSGIGFGLGTLSGWSITFDDPEISYTGNYTWSPTTNMTNSTSLNPTVCPTATSTYTLNVADTAGCTSASDDVTITIDNNCCNFNIGAVVTQPTCGASNGAIDISITNGSGNYTYNWTSGQGSNQDLNNIAAGTYNLTVTDVTQACSKDTVITLNQASGLVIDSVVSYNPTCHDSCNGGIQVYPSSVGLTYTWYDELNNIIGSNSNSISNLCSGNYSVLVESSTSTILNSNYDFEQGPGGSCDCPTGFTCGNDAGQVFDGIHPVYAAGNRGCIASSTNYTNSLGASGGNGYVYFYAGGDNIISTPSYSFIGGETVEICVDYSGPQGSGAPGQNTANAYFSLGVDGVRVGNNVLVPTNTAWTQYCFTITMSAGSHSFDILSGGAAEYSMWFDNFTVTIINSGSTCQQTFEDTLINPTQTDASFNFNDFCYGTINGPTNITTVGGIFTFNPIPSDGASINSTTGEISNEVSGTTYSIEYSLLGTCPASSIETVSVNGSSINAISTTPASCGNADGTITITASGGTAPLQYSIDGSTYQASNVFSNQSAGSYTVYVRDTNLCVDDSTTTISNAGGAIITDVTNTPTSCGNNDGTITITASGGTAPLQYSIDGT